MIICVEGVDRSGKDTLIQNYDKKFKWLSINLNRGPVGKIFYDTKYNRIDNFRFCEALDEIKAIQSTRHLWIFLKPPVEEILKRLKEENSNCLDTIESVNKEIDEYYNLFKKYYTDEENTLVLESTDINENIELIYQKVSFISNEKFLLTKNKNFTNIESRPSIKENTYKEYNPFIQYFNSYNLKDKNFDSNIDDEYYKMLEYSLYHLIHLYRLKWINKRQIVYTSNECISMIQIIPGSITKYIVHQRSLNTNTNGFNDILFFKYFNDKYFHNKFEIYYSCGIPHMYE